MDRRRSVCIPQADMLPDNIFHRRQRRARSSSTNSRRDRENTSPAETIRQSFCRRHSYVSSPSFCTENSRAEKNISPSKIRSSSRTSKIAIAKRQISRDGTSKIWERPSRDTGSNSSRSTLRCRSACRSTSRSKCSSSRAFNINRRGSIGHEGKRETDTRVKRATVHGETVISNGRGNKVKDRENSRCYKMKNVKRVNHDGEKNVCSGGGDGKEDDIAQLEKRLNSIRQLTRDLEIELQCRRDEYAGHDGHFCSESGDCGDSDDNVDNTSLSTLRLSNRRIDKDNTDSKDYKSQVKENAGDKRIDKTELLELTKYAPNHISHSSKDATLPKNNKERKRNNEFGRYPETKQHAVAQKPSETTTPKPDRHYPRRASTGGISVDYHSRPCQRKYPASPFQEFKEETKSSCFISYTGDSESHLIPAASGNLSKHSIFVDCTEDMMSSLGYSSDGNNNKNSVLTVPSKFQETKVDQDSQHNSDLVPVTNCPSKDNQASTCTSSLYSEKFERRLIDHENDKRFVIVQPQTYLSTEKNNIKTTATADVDILHSSLIVCAHLPPPPPRKTTPATSSKPPQSLPCSSQKPLHSFNRARWTDNGSDPTASTCSSSASSSSLSRPSTSKECIQFIQTCEILCQNTAIVSNLRGNEHSKSDPSIVSSDVKGLTSSRKTYNNGSARNSVKRLSVTFQHPLEEIMALSDAEIKSTTQEQSLSGRERCGYVPLKLQQRPLQPFPNTQSHFPPPHRDRALQFHRSISMDSKLTHSNNKSNCNKGREDFAFVRPPPLPPRQHIAKSDGTQFNSLIKTRNPSGLEDDDSYDTNRIIASTPARHDETMKKKDLNLKYVSGFRPPPPRRKSNALDALKSERRKR